MSQVPPGFNRTLAQQIQTARPGFRFESYYWVREPWCSGMPSSEHSSPSD